ncbi:MAG TPA: extracellular solute-binding protein [Planctomycetota bacterium]|nr:extracellular solute-binding protein [Planctomycetota bacterium]
MNSICPDAPPRGGAIVSRPPRRRPSGTPLVLLAALAVGACSEANDLTVYCALDQEHSQAMIARFEAATGKSVKKRFDTEGDKTVGLVSAIHNEAASPRCDVFWNNELAHTVRLGQKGLLQPYVSPSAAALPAQFKDKDGLWTGFAARARVFIVNESLVPDRGEWPKSMWDLLDPKWKGRCAIARPLTGTTLTHFTALRLVLGEQEFQRFVDGLFANEVVFLQSNAATMRAVAAGDLAFAFTDTDDYHVAKTKGHPVGCVFPDQEEGQIGTMLIPNSVAIIKGAPHPEAARAFVDWLLAEETEGLLAAAKSAQIPLRASVPGPPDPAILAFGSFRSMAWDPAATAEALERTLADMRKRF